MADKKKPRSFDGFGELSRHVHSQEHQRKLDRAVALAQAGQAIEAARVLDHHELQSEPQASRHLYGWCYAEAAKAQVLVGDLTAAQSDLRKATGLSYRPWHVEKRLSLVSHARSTGWTREPEPDWIERLSLSCDSCHQNAPTPLTCAKCNGTLQPTRRPVYQANLVDLYSLGAYRWQGDPNAANALSRMIRWMKKNQGKELCKYLAFLLVMGLHENSDRGLCVDVIVPVPCDPERNRERGFDNVAELVCVMEHIALIPLAAGVLIKTKATADLRQLPWRQRPAALAGSIEADVHKKHQIQDSSILLVDDVVTSGSTLDLCAGILKAAGARQVFGATLARSESTQESQRWEAVDADE